MLLCLFENQSKDIKIDELFVVVTDDHWSPGRKCSNALYSNHFSFVFLSAYLTIFYARPFAQVFPLSYTCCQVASTLILFNY